jgi:hypothetical protein
VVDGVGEEVGIDQDRVGWLEGGVVLEEHATGRLRTVKYYCQLGVIDRVLSFVQNIHCSDELIFAALLLLFVEWRGLVFLEAVVALTDDSLDGRELACLLLDTHGEMWSLVF